MIKIERKRLGFKGLERDIDRGREREIERWRLGFGGLPRESEGEREKKRIKLGICRDRYWG